MAETRAQRLREYLDCGTFIAGWVVADTGKMPGGDWWKGSYRSMKSLDAMMADAGFASHVEYIASLVPNIAPAQAVTGDLMVVEGRAMGICAGERVFVLRPDGIGHVSRMLAERAFRI